MVSIITVTFNAEATLERTLQSIEAQSYRDFEIVAIDGGSTDGTVEIFKRHSSHLGVLVSEADNGVYDAMNKGIAAAKGEILFFLNAQDTFYDNEVLARVVEAFSSANRPYIVFGDVFFTNLQGVPDNELSTVPNQVRCYKDAGPNEPGICHQCIFYRKELFERLGGYDLRYRIFGDFDFNIRAFDFAGDRYKYIPYVIANFDLGGLSTLTNTKHSALQHKENMELREKYESMKRRTAARKFVFSCANSICDGGYYVQLFGLRIDWTPFMRYRKMLPADVPFSFDFRYGVPDVLHLKGFENVLNGAVNFSKEKTGVGFRVPKSSSAVGDLTLAVVLFAGISKAGSGKVRIAVNGRQVDTIAFDGWCEGYWRDLLFSCDVDADCLRTGWNEVSFELDAGDMDIKVGLQGISLGKRKALSAAPVGEPLWFAIGDIEKLPFSLRGFYAPEEWGSWLHPVAVMKGKLQCGRRNVAVESYWRAFLWTAERSIGAEIRVNGKVVSVLEFKFGESLPAQRTFVIPAEVLEEDGSFVMEVRSLNPVVPAEHLVSADRRRLSAALCSLKFT